MRAADSTRPADFGKLSTPFRNYTNVLGLASSSLLWHSDCIREQTVPRKSPFTITLSDHERRELQRRACSYTLPYFQVIRARMILLAAQNLDNNLIADRLNTRREVVSLWRKRFFEHRLAGLDELPRPGRPRAFPLYLV